MDAQPQPQSQPQPIDDIYDYPRYYDIVFTAGWQEELEFLEHCFAQHAEGNVAKVLEPACGTGRLVWRLAKQGYDVAGIDLNPKAVRYCNDRLRRHGLNPTAIVGDMTKFTLADFSEAKAPPPFDAAFNLINSFRHLLTEGAALNHLSCMADAIRPGGLYILGLHLLPAADAECGHEQWEESRGGIHVRTILESVELDRKARHETITFRYEVEKGNQHKQLQGELHFRTYTHPEFLTLIQSAASWEIIETYDFHLDDPVYVTEESEDVVFVLRRK